jgi:YfiH family protein
MMLDMMDLPQPSEPFEWVQAAGSLALICGALTPLARHLYTARGWGLGGDLQQWDEVAAALGIPPAGLIRARQVHGAGVLRASQAIGQPPGSIEADIVLAGPHDATAAGVQAADCVPLLLADPQTGAVTAAHAGWRGLAAGVPGAAVSAMAKMFGTAPGDIVAAIGPSVGACCYEVGADVKERFDRAGFGAGRAAAWFHDQPPRLPRNPPMASVTVGARDGRWFFDGWAAARDQLADAGVPPAQIFAAELCTASHGAFCSYRRDGARAGRNLAAIRPGPDRRDP